MEQHTTIIRSDEPVQVTVTSDGAWFQVWRQLVRSGLWADLPAAAQRVLLPLLDLVNDQIRRDSGDWMAWPSIDTLSAAAGIDPRNVKRGIKALEERKVLVVLRGGGTETSRYRLQPPNKWKLDGLTPVPYGRPVTESAPVAKTSPVSESPPQGGRFRHGGGGENVTQKNRIERPELKNNNSTVPADDDRSVVVVDELDCGMHPSVIDRLLTEHPITRIKDVLAAAMTRADDPAAYIVSAEPATRWG